jgi:hypothetical protein
MGNEQSLESSYIVHRAAAREPIVTSAAKQPKGEDSNKENTTMDETNYVH